MPPSNQDGDFIAVRLCARFGGWELVAKNGMLKITKSDTASKNDYNVLLKNGRC